VFAPRPDQADPSDHPQSRRTRQAGAAGSQDELAVDLLNRLKKSQAEAFDREDIRVRPPITRLSRGDLWFDIPDSWAFALFDDLFVIISGVTKGQKIPQHEAVDVPYLRVANVQRGYLDLDVIKTISVRKSDEERYALRDGDILMTEGGDWDKLGRAAIWRGEVDRCIHQNHVFRVRPPSGELSRNGLLHMRTAFSVVHFLKMPRNRRQISLQSI
jgi:type I restriction enzyme S subunit